MYLTNENEHEYRYKTRGPKYLAKGPNVDMGVVVITPNESHPCHRHTQQEESFLVLKGECDVWVEGELVKLKEGDYLVCQKGEAHYFHNTSEKDFKAVFTKAPHLDFKDSLYIDWTPEKEWLG
jgi:quercetin dioxygenase-like cupin family protein